MVSFSLELKDRLVDRILSKKKLVGKSNIYYSPISSWFVFWMLLLSVSLPVFPLIVLSSEFLFNYVDYILMSLLVYFTLGYFIIAGINHSFVVSKQKLLVIRSCFPFQACRQFDLDRIISIKIDSSRKLWILSLIGLFLNNYVEITTNAGKHRNYCLFLDFDCYDENWTQLTLDDLEMDLKNRNVNVSSKY